jgi:nucleotide-binding universal stress UspA family protein
MVAAEREGWQLLDAAVGRIHREHCEQHVATRLCSGKPSVELLLLAADADQVVVGSRGHGGFATLLLGSTAAQVAAHAPCPVVVVRDGAAADGPVVVGVDGSDPGDAALAYGFSFAARHGLPLRAVHAYPNYALLPAYPMPPLDMDRLREGAEWVLGRALDQWSAKHPEVPVEQVVVDGTVAHCLVEASKGASLLVAGSRGHGGFAGMLLGSVSQAVIRHAHCPVAVTH